MDRLILNLLLSTILLTPHYYRNYSLGSVIESEKDILIRVTLQHNVAIDNQLLHSPHFRPM